MTPEATWWILFNAFVLAMLALDLGVFHRKAHVVGMREALTWSGIWISIALLFNLGIFLGWFGPYTDATRDKAALEFLTGYLIEKSLSVDNVFVFALLFAYFQIPAQYQHRVLFWGILGALVMRAILIFAGVALLAKFHWLIYVFGALLIVSGIKMWLAHGQQMDPQTNPVLRFIRRILPVSKEHHGQRFFVREAGRWAVTPLFVVLLFVEWSDLIFAVDSIPAILAITQDPFIVYTSNVLAILGLRSLYFALAGVMQKFHLLHYGLSAILVFVGTKMMLVEIYKIPTAASLGVVGGILVVSVIASLRSAPPPIADAVSAAATPATDAEKEPAGVGGDQR
jgi:tellurite resistance protein TerC